MLMLTAEHTLAAIELMAATGMRLPSKIVTGQDQALMAQLWALALHDVAPEDLMAAALAYASSSPSGFIPTPGELRTYLPGYAGSAVSVFAELVQAAGNPADAPQLDRRATAALRAIGGMRALSVATPYDLGALRRAFIDVYEHQHATEAAAKARGLIEALPFAELPGPLRDAVLLLEDGERG